MLVVVDVLGRLREEERKREEEKRIVVSAIKAL